MSPDVTPAERLTGKRRGVTLIELLVAMTILAVLVLVIGNALVPSLQITGRSGTAASSTAVARGVLDHIESQWSVPAAGTALTPAEVAVRRDRYDRSCVEMTAAFTGMPANAATAVTGITPSITGGADTTQTLTLNPVTAPATCTATPDDPTFPLKRVVVTVTGPNGATSSRLTLELRRP